VYKKDGNMFALYQYNVTESYETKPTDVQILLPKDGKNLTLFTCTDIGSDKMRWIIKSELKNTQYVSATSTQAAFQTPPSELSYSFTFKVQRLVNSIDNTEDRIRKKELIIKLVSAVRKLEAENRISSVKAEYIKTELVKVLKKM
jgi:hypothetical protein